MRLNTVALQAKYSKEQIENVALIYFELANVTETAKKTGIPISTIKTWIDGKGSRDASQIFHAMIANIRSEDADRLDIKLTRALNASLARVEERLAKGDVRLDKDGNERYVPVSAKDAAVITSILFEKRQLLRLAPTRITESGSDKLNAIAEKLAAITKAKDEAIELEYTVSGEDSASRD